MLRFLAVRSNQFLLYLTSCLKGHLHLISLQMLFVSNVKENLKVEIIGADS